MGVVLSFRLFPSLTKVSFSRSAILCAVLVFTAGIFTLIEFGGAGDGLADGLLAISAAIGKVALIPLVPEQARLPEQTIDSVCIASGLEGQKPTQGEVGFGVAGIPGSLPIALPQLGEFVAIGGLMGLDNQLSI